MAAGKGLMCSASASVGAAQKASHWLIPGEPGRREGAFIDHQTAVAQFSKKKSGGTR